MAKTSNSVVKATVPTAVKDKLEGIAKKQGASLSNVIGKILCGKLTLVPSANNKALAELQTLVRVLLELKQKVSLSQQKQIDEVLRCIPKVLLRLLSKGGK